VEADWLRFHACLFVPDCEATFLAGAIGLASALLFGLLSIGFDTVITKCGGCAMRLREILDQKSYEVRTIASHASCDDVLNELVSWNIGSLLVRDAAGGPVLGIITERDLLKAQAANRVPLAQLPVVKFMTTKLISARPDDDITVAMGLMTTHRIRHLPVISDGQLHGLVSIGDIVKAQHDELVMENHHMRSYIQGGGGSAIAPV
jgi:signal-transduction protein with cAMP-binding, CBS, and nucleotidyltransferase domain